ncbi:MAG TPA: 50S ribosomal protein L10 [Gaiellaceae bacterium]|nr:50S ribosomal protein L10 [Gaiellaceae bacterium]
MLRSNKEKIVAELTERLRAVETLIVTDYRGLSVKEIDELRTKLLEHGARFVVVKNSLTRRAAEAAGAEQVLALLEGPTAIAFLEADGDPVAVAKAISDTARLTRVLTVRGGVMQGRVIGADAVEELAKLPPIDALRAQVLGAVTAPVQAIAALLTAPLRELHGLLQARIDQLAGEQAASPVPQASSPEAGADVAAAAEAETQAPRADGEARAAAAAETRTPGVEAAEVAAPETEADEKEA